MFRMNKNLLYPELSYKVCGLFFCTHNELGRYRNEKQYSDYFENLLKEEKIGYLREKAIPASFLGEKERRNIPDFFIENKIIIDFKAKSFTTKEDYFQMQRYLESYGRELGLIVNFRQKYLRPKRILRRVS